MQKNSARKGMMVMVKKQTTMGSVLVTENFFLDLVSDAIQDCYGVVGMSHTDTLQNLKTLLFKKEVAKKGVRITGTEDHLIIDLHIEVLHGVPIAAIVKSIVHRVKYSVEEATGFHVSKINVFVDGMRLE